MIKLEKVHVTERIIGAAIRVQTALGTGLAERIYRRALAVELRASGLAAQEEHAVKVFYRGVDVGAQSLDLVVRDGDDLLVVELKHFAAADRARWDLAMSQTQTYLAATASRLGLVLNFGVVPLGIRRVVNPQRRLEGRA